jgi:F-type H+-transporting ATPase subunit b
MHIDWFVFFAQIVNFLILVFLLKYLLYGRIIKAMDEREAKIVSRLDEADRLKKEAQETAAACELKNQSLNDMVEEMMNKAREAAENSRRELTQMAREEVDQIQQRWYQALSREKKAFLENLSHRAGTYVYDTIRRILSDLADAELEQMIVNVFIRRIKAAEKEKLSILSGSAVTAETSVTIRSAFELSADQRSMISDALKPYLARDAKIRYEPLSEEVAGIEMMVHGHKFSWSINDYIVSLEESFSRVLKEEIPSIPDA